MKLVLIHTSKKFTHRVARIYKTRQGYRAYIKWTNIDRHMRTMNYRNLRQIHDFLEGSPHA